MNRNGRSRASKSGRSERPVLMRHPFSGADPQQLSIALAAYADSQADAFPQAVLRLLTLLGEVYPPHLLSSIAYWGLQGTVTDNGVSDQALIKSVQQHQVELLQALILTLKPETWGQEPATPKQIQLAIDTLEEISSAFWQRRYSVLSEDRSDEERTVIALQERLRMYTQMVRNWTYRSEGLELARKLYGPLDARLRDRHGFSASQLMDISQILTKNLEARINDRFRKLQIVFRTKSLRQLARAFCNQFPELNINPEALLASIPAGISSWAVRAHLLALTDRVFVTAPLIDRQSVSAQTGLELEDIERVLAHLTLEEGSLVDADPEHFFMSNPIWKKPIIAIGNDLYLPIPQIIFSFLFNILDSLFDNQQLKLALQERRTAFLEDEVANIISQALPEAAVRRSVAWNWQGRRYESDVVALLDRTMVVVEAKSGTLSSEALRGAPKRVKRHVQELVVAPAQQSARLERIVREAREGNVEAKVVLTEFGTCVEDIDNVIRLSVTIDDLSMICSAEGDLKRAGWVPHDLELAPACTIADLSCVTQILDQPALLLHYLMERSRLQRSMQIFGDEMDFLGSYLQLGFNFSTGDGKIGGMSILGMSQPIDRYFNSREAGINIAKPKPRMTDYFHNLITQLSARRPSGWSTMALDLLRLLGPDEQKQLDRELEKLRISVPKKNRDPKHANAVSIRSSLPRDFVGVFHVCTDRHASQRRDVVTKLAANAMEEAGVDRCVVVSRFVENWKLPYHMVAIMRS